MAGWLVPCIWYLGVTCREPFSDLALVATTSTKVVPQLSEALPFPSPGVTGDTLDIAKALGLPVSRFPVWQA